MNRQNFPRILIVFLISLFIQLIFIFVIVDIPLHGDAGVYDRVAVNLIAGKGFTSDGVNPSPGFVKQGYVLFLAIIYKIFGHSIYIAKVIQSLFISLTVVMTYKIGKELFNEHIGYYSSLIMAFHPIFFIISSHIISESIFTFLLAVTIFYLIMAMKNRSLKLYLISAIFLGITTQVRFTPVFFPFFITIGLMLFYKNRLYALKLGSLIFLIFVAIQVPWIIRNYVHFGHLNPFVEYGGALWLGSYTKGKADDCSPIVKRALFDSIRSLYLEKRYPMNKMDSRVEMQWQEALLKSAFDNIRKDPLGYLALIPKKILKLWVGSYSGLFMIDRAFSDFLHNKNLIKDHLFILMWKSYVLLFSFATFFLSMLGAIINVKRWKETLPLYLIVFYFIWLHIIIFSNTRMGIPALPYMIIFASLALSKLLERKRGISLF